MPARTLAWIEDDSYALDGIMMPLRKVGFTIVKYFSYAEAMRHIGIIKQCDIIIVDLILPPGKDVKCYDHIVDEYQSRDLYGLRILYALCNDSTFDLKKPIIILSVIAHEEERARAEELRRLNVHLLAKPAHGRDVKAEVYKLLNLAPDGAS